MVKVNKQTNSVYKKYWWQLLVVLVIIIALIYAFTNYFNSNKNTYQPSQVTQPSSSSENGQITITLTASGFNPQSVTIKQGAKVVWLNKSGNDATVNSNPHPTHTDYSPLNLGRFGNGESLSLTFDQKGTYGYHNHLDPSQTGTIIVE